MTNHPLLVGLVGEQPADDVARHEAIGVLMKKDIGEEYNVGTTPNILGYSAIGTTKDYYYERYNAAAFTFEGAYKVEQKNFEKHVKFWDEVLQNL